MKNLKWEIKSRECGGFCFPSFFWGAGYLQSMLNSSASMVLDSGSSVRPFASSSFSAQSGTQPFVHHGGEILQQEDAIQKAFFSFKWARTNYHYALVFFFHLFWNQVLHGGRSTKLSSTYKVAYVWCLNLCEISLSLCVSLQVICKDCTTFKEIIACSLCRMHCHQGIRGWQGVFQLEHINLLGVVSPPTTCLLVCLRFMLTLL